MRLEGDHAFDGPRPAVWDMLLDPDVMARALPGTERLERVAEDEYRGVMRVGVGPVTAGRYDVTVRIVDKAPPARYTMEIDGRGALGFARGTAQVTLEEEGPERTRMRYAADLQIGGKVAGVGQRLIESVSRSLTAQGLAALNGELEARLARRGKGAKPGPAEPA
ncbi:MAG TPA: carbon monoxide dehydrogenase subunit G [Gemmatimonadota bacterium]|nr:carbon monoxide dehydrogenase subunit G [Gemmatimonadota bacterium]